MCHMHCADSCAGNHLKLPSTKRFRQVIQACAERENTWINRDIIDSYTRLHELGHAHSVEAWKENNSPAAFTASQSAARSLANRCFIA